MSRGLVLLLAVAGGASVANLYYAQPLLDTIAHAFGISSGAAGLLVTATQVGYVVGLLLVVPLGDLLERSRLVSRVLAITAGALAVTAAAPSVAVLAAALAVVGVTSVVAQILVPFAATLAADEQRGRVLGLVMSGLLVGILLARTVSGLLAALGGWRLVFGLAAAGMLVLSVVLGRALPRVAPPADVSYRTLLASTARLVREEPVLRRRMAYGACGMAAFSVLWTSLAFLLAAPPYGYSDAVIGLFGLLGLAGALGAQWAGRVADRGRVHLSTGAFLATILAGWGLLALGRTDVLALGAGIVLLDLGVQGANITSQTMIYAVRPEARSRMTTGYMTAVFLGAATGSALSGILYDADGWTGVCALGAAITVLALGLFAQEQATRRRRRRGAPSPASAH